MCCVPYERRRRGGTVCLRWSEKKRPAHLVHWPNFTSQIRIIKPITLSYNTYQTYVPILGERGAFKEGVQRTLPRHSPPLFLPLYPPKTLDIAVAGA